MSANPEVVVVGGANVDYLGRPNAPLLAQDSNPGSVLTRPGGVGRNIAESLSSLGCRVGFVSAVGQDHQGGWLLEQTAAAGVDVSGVLSVEDHPTASYLAVLDDTGDLSVALADMAVIDELGPTQLHALQHWFAHCQVVVADTNLPTPVLDWLMGNIEVPLFVDPVSMTKAGKLAERTHGIYAITPSLDEAQALTALPHAGYAELAAWFHEHGVSEVYLTLGAQGLFYSVPGGQALCPVKRPQAPKHSSEGAGDALMAGLVHGYLQSWRIEQRVDFAMQHAAALLSR